MKKIAFSVLFLVSVSVHAQSFRLYNVVDEVEGDEIANGAVLSYVCAAEEVDGILCATAETCTILENKSDVDKVVVCKRDILLSVDGMETFFCWSTCNSSSVSIDERSVSANTKTEAWDFTTHYAAPLVAGTSRVRYTFYDKENPSDAISVTFEYITPPDLHTPVHLGAISLSIYPNPTMDYLTVATNDLPLKQAAIVLFDATGRLLKTQSLTSSATKIDVNYLEQGIYYLQIINDGNIVGFRKFIKE